MGAHIFVRQILARHSGGGGEKVAGQGTLGEKFAAVPCLNDSGPGMLVIWQMVLRELKGWI